MESQNKTTNKKPNQFKIWLISNGISQKELSLKCNVGVTNLHHLINEGKYTPRTIKSVAEALKSEYQKDITEEMIVSMVEITN